MEYQLVEGSRQPFIESLPESGVIKTENDALDWVGYCGENQVRGILLHAENFSPEFFDLSSGLAGSVLLKFSVYSLRVAALLRPEQVNHGKFQEFVSETNRGNQFRVFYNREDAAAWLGS